MMLLGREEATSEIHLLIHREEDIQGPNKKAAVCSQPALAEIQPCYHAGGTLAAFPAVRKHLSVAAGTHYAIASPQPEQTSTLQSSEQLPILKINSYIFQ